MNARALPETFLEERYTAERGTVFLTGTQALLRVALDWRRRDIAAGVRSSCLFTGYPGSPLAGIDLALRQRQALLDRYDIRHIPGQNEELAATALMGTQMLDEHPHADHDGVVGFWYGKGPGVDRASDALKHGNFAGTSKHGAVVILSGEDHEAKSSSVPYQQEHAFEHLGIPVLYPSSIEEILRLGQHAIAASRYSGCWIAMKLVGPLCDGGATVNLSPSLPMIRLPELAIDGKPFQKRANFRFFPVENLATERHLYEERLVAVQAYAGANALDEIVVRSSNDRIGIVAAGKSYADTLGALQSLGLDLETMQRLGIRLMKLGLVWPLAEAIVKQFAEGLEEIVVIEEKRDFLERQIGRRVCSIGPIRVVGKHDESGKRLFPQHGAFDADLIAPLLAARLAAYTSVPPRAAQRLWELESVAKRTYGTLPRRTPNYCSGCPHNVSTKLADGQVAWGSPGCHAFALLMDQPDRSIAAVTQYGGEGLPWIGLAPYTTRKHIVQNVGDGSLFHSSYLNIRFAVTAGVNITFKILFNGALANTGGQAPSGMRTVPELVSLLATERVSQIIVVTKEPERYRRVRLAGRAIVRPACEIEQAMAQLAAVEGVTVLIYDEQCANERRRQQKRGTLPRASLFTFVNEEVCENCGDCGRVANCMSLQKVDTEFGQKTQIHASSCNQDRLCLSAECPSFVTVQTKAPAHSRRRDLPFINDDFPAPKVASSCDRPYAIYMPGLGGTGVITVNAILAEAAVRSGLHAATYDQTGAAQKWGAVLSSLILSKTALTSARNRVQVAGADLYLALDLIAAVDARNLDRCSVDRTIAVINSSVLPSGEMIRNVRLTLPVSRMIQTIRDVTDPSRAVVLDARAVAESLFDDHLMTNMVAVGAAYQAGLLPIPPESIEQAVRLNGTQVDANLSAFRAGRMSQHDPERLSRLIERPYRAFADRVAEHEHKRSARRASVGTQLISEAGLARFANEHLSHRVTDLLEYQGKAYARRYLEVVGHAAAREAATLSSGDSAITQTVIVNLHKLMAYKDEYEVARLLTMSTFTDRVKQQFAGDVSLRYHLQPPVLRALGLRRKVAVGEWAIPLLRLLARMKLVRGTPLDLFGHTKVRRAERRLILWYASLVSEALASLSPANAATVRKLLAIPEDIRGYEHIKLESIEQAEKAAVGLLDSIRQAAASA